MFLMFYIGGVRENTTTLGPLPTPVLSGSGSKGMISALQLLRNSTPVFLEGKIINIFLTEKINIINYKFDK